MTLYHHLDRKEFVLSHMKLTKFSVLILLFAANLLSGQIKDKETPQIDEKELAKYLQKQSEQRPMPQAIEGAVDPAAYRVGPGDVLRISFWGPSSEDNGISASVTPEGKLIIPSVGTIDVNNKTLQAVRAEVSHACEAKYDPRNISVTTDLTQLRLVRAHILGEVNAPGSFNATAVDRISYFIQQAESWTDWADERRVEVRHTDGTVDTLDMYKLYHEGDLTQDPYVRGGDVIYVPRIELTGRTVFLEGLEQKQGPHQIARDESLLEFLYRVKAIQRSTDLDRIYLIRGNQPPTPANLFGNGANHSSASSLMLEDGDRIVATELKGFVYVHGAVKNPGNFPYVPGFKAVDYVGFAGGTQEMANLKNIKIVHNGSGMTEKGGNSEVKRGDTIIVPLSSRVKLSQYLLIVSQIATLVIAAVAVSGQSGSGGN